MQLSGDFASYKCKMCKAKEMRKDAFQSDQMSGKSRNSQKGSSTFRAYLGEKDRIVLTMTTIVRREVKIVHRPWRAK